MEVEQETSITSKVILNSISGRIITVNATIPPNSSITFTMINSCVYKTSSVFLSLNGGTSNFMYVPFGLIYAHDIKNGSFNITIGNSDIGCDLVGNYIISFFIVR